MLFFGKALMIFGKSVDPKFDEKKKKKNLAMRGIFLGILTESDAILPSLHMAASGTSHIQRISCHLRQQ